MTDYLRSTLTILLTMLLSSEAFALAAINSSTSIVQNPKKEGRRWSGFAYVSRSTNLYDFQDGSRSDGVDYLGRLNYKINSDFFVRLQVGYSQDLKNSERSDFNDGSISINRVPKKLSQYLLWGYSGALTAPFSKDSRIRQGLITSAKAGGVLMANPDQLITGLNLVGSLTLARNFHEYETAAPGDTALNGIVNSQYSSTQGVAVSYDFTSGVSISADFTHYNYLSYQNVAKEAFIFTQEIGYQIGSSFSLAAGHTNSGSVLKANGVDSNIQLMDETSSTVYLSGTYIF